MMTCQELDIKYGFEQGIEQGVKRGIDQAILNMLGDNITPHRVARLCNRPISEVLALRSKKVSVEEGA